MYPKTQEAKAAAAVLACEDDIVKRMGKERAANKFAVLWDWNDPATTWFAKNGQKTRRPWDQKEPQEEGVNVGKGAEPSRAEDVDVIGETGNALMGDEETLGMKRIDAMIAAHPPCTGSWYWMKEVNVGEPPGRSFSHFLPLVFAKHFDNRYWMCSQCLTPIRRTSRASPRSDASLQRQLHVS